MFSGLALERDIVMDNLGTEVRFETEFFSDAYYYIHKLRHVIWLP